MSGYIGENPKKMKRGWIEITNPNDIIEYQTVTEEVYSIIPNDDPIYYSVIVFDRPHYNDYGRVDGTEYSFFNECDYTVYRKYINEEKYLKIQPGANEWIFTTYNPETIDDVLDDYWYSMSEVTSEKYHPHYGTLRKVIRKAWVGNQNSEPELVLYSPDYIDGEEYIHNKFNAETPYDFSYAETVVYNNKIHAILSDKHYSWSLEAGWTEESTPSFNTLRRAVVYDNKIFIATSTKLYSWDGTSWTERSTLPYEFNNGSLIVCNSELHIMGGYDSFGNDSTSHYSWDGTSWTERSTLPISVIGQIVSLTSDGLGICIGFYSKCWRSDYPNWTKVRWERTDVSSSRTYWRLFDEFGYSIGNYTYTQVDAGLFGCNKVIQGTVGDDAFWSFGPIGSYRVSYKYTVTLNQGIPYAYYQHLYTFAKILSNCRYKSCVLYNNKIYAFGTDNIMYTYNPFINKWLPLNIEPTIPCYFYNSHILLHNSKMHIFGSYMRRRYSAYPYDSSIYNRIYTNPKKEPSTNLMSLHFEFDSENDTWIDKNDIDINIYGAVIYNNTIYLMGRDYLYSYNNGVLTQEVELPNQAILVDNDQWVLPSGSSSSKYIGYIPLAYYVQPIFSGVVDNKLFICKIYSEDDTIKQKFYLLEENGFEEHVGLSDATCNVICEDDKIYYTTVRGYYYPSGTVVEEHVKCYNLTTGQTKTIKKFSGNYLNGITTSSRTSTRNTYYHFICRNSMILFDNYIGLIYSTPKPETRVTKFIILDKNTGETIKEIVFPDESYNPDGARAIYYDGYIYIYGGISTTARPEAYGVSEARSRKLFKINISNYFN